MTAQVHAFPTNGSGLPAPLVPAEVDVRGLPNCMAPCDMYDGDWAGSATDAEWRTGMLLYRRSLEQLPGGSLPQSDVLLARLADMGRDAEAFQKVKLKAMEGWRLCSDGRYYRAEAAINALCLWLGKLLRRRHSALMNRKQHPDKDFGVVEIDVAIDAAVAAFMLLDPQDATLRDVQAKIARWKPRKPEFVDVEPAPDPVREPSSLSDLTVLSAWDMVVVWKRWDWSG